MTHSLQIGQTLASDLLKRLQALIDVGWKARRKEHTTSDRS